jgi:hypothetical protein
MAKKRQVVEIEAEIGLNATNRQQMALTGWSPVWRKKGGGRAETRLSAVKTARIKKRHETNDQRGVAGGGRICDAGIRQRPAIRRRCCS